MCCAQRLREQGLFNVCIHCEFLFSSRGFRSRFALELPTNIVQCSANRKSTGAVAAGGLVAVRYDLGLMYVRFVGTHRQYDKIAVKTI
jgi:HigB_toxin, RelE-like toxic component of a toxin-antitoxin system